MKFIALRLIRFKLRSTLPAINKNMYKNLFNLTYKMFVYLKPSQIWVIILALLNRTEFKKFVSIPSIFILFSTLFLDNNPKDVKIDYKTSTNLLLSRLEINKFTDEGNSW